MAEARIYPPSEQRLAEARRAGHVPRGSFVVFAAVLAGVSFSLDGWGMSFLGRLGTLWREWLEGVAHGRVPDASQVLRERVPQLLWPSLASLGALFVIAAGLSFLAQGSARFLPFARVRRHFAPAQPPRASKLLWSLLVLLLAISALYEFVRIAPNTAGSELSRWLLRLSALTALVSVLDVALARASFLRSLWLTRREHLDEQREAYGSPEMRAERARLRRELP